jgi:two-component system, cell cycle sensor histidine kinase and response regulator CckA
MTSESLPAGDATQRLARAQQALRSSDQLFRALFDQTLDAILIVDDEGRYVDVNPAACGLFGVGREQLIGRCIAEFADYGVDVHGAWSAFRATGHRVGALRLVRPDGQTRETEFAARADFLPGFHLSIMRDVTDRKRDARARRDSDERYRQLFEAIPQPVIVSDVQTKAILAANEAACRQYGYSREEFSRLGAGDLRMPDAPAVIAAFAPVGDGARHAGVTRHRAKDGRAFEASIACHSLTFDGGRVILSVVTDVTESGRAEQALRASEERFRRIVETAAEGVWLLDADAVTSYVNERMASMLGYTTAEMLGQHLFDFLREDLRESAADRIARHRTGQGDQFEPALRRKDGSEVSVFISSNPVFGTQGEYLGVLAMVTDMTERRLLEDQLRHAQKMDSIGRFAGSIAHDFNNLLGVIMGYSDAALRRVSDPEAVRLKLEGIQKAADRAAALTRQILAFSRRQVLVPRLLDLGTVVDDLNGMLHRLIGEDIELMAVVQPGLGRVRADPGQIEQVIINLAANARDAMPDGGRLVMELRNAEVDERRAAEHARLAPGSYVVLEVRDTGVGIPPELLERIFEPFFTTKEPGKGTGLGLATVYGIVEQSGGSITVGSEVGRGTTFTIYVPRVPVSARPRRDRDDDVDVSPRGTETVLFVEDDDVMRTVAEETLTAFGYRVITAAGPYEALEIYRKLGDRPPMLVTDLVMPGMNGRELADRLVGEQPDLRVLLISGYSSDDLMRQQVAEEGRAFLQKPFTPVALARKIRELLDHVAA